MVEISEMNPTSTTNNGFNFRIVNSLMESWGLRLTWLDCKFKKIQIQIIMYNIRISYGWQKLYRLYIDHQEKILRGKVLSGVNGEHCYYSNNCCFIAGNFFPKTHALIGYFEVT